MNTPETDAKTETPALVETSTLGAKGPENIPTVCFLCTNKIKHADVVLLGHSDTDVDIAVHPNCLLPGVNDHIKDLKLIHVHVEKGQRISPAKMIVVKKTMKAIWKAITVANARKQQEKANG